ncbi:agmatine deiminase [Clostridium vincentii]|uniref:Putative agmatine deiminase n=1 Tax=Clostridium vincentii TaxID=52704 RepID=A0A2T0BAS0_9CLOT|nr:agmatine deiminase [Clostridium vincentii]PRR81006.1 putative agmatine deiminase [Clostridium vincentii]
MRVLSSIPKKDGFKMPGEFEPHAGSYMLWPERTDNWRALAKPAQKAFVEVAKAIAKFEPVTMGVSEAQYDIAREMLPDYIRVVEIANNDSWVRDSGPTFIKNKDGAVRGIDWGFNAWGGLIDGLYFPWDKDEKVARKICEIERKDIYEIDNFVLEGGSVHVDGEGTALVTEECLLSVGRNPTKTKKEIEDTIKNYLNVEKVIWLKRGIFLDETNEHIDNIATFVKPSIIALAWSDNEEDPQYELSLNCYEILKNETDAKGRSFEIHKILVPEPMYILQDECLGIEMVIGTKSRHEGERLAASYINYYVANGGVVMPIFGDKNDILAVNKIKELYPDREVIPIYTREILLGGGNIHCITQQIPK